MIGLTGGRRTSYSPGCRLYWHGTLRGDVVAAGLAACGLQLRAQILWVKQHFALSRGDYHWKHRKLLVRGEGGQVQPLRQGSRTQTTVWEIANNKIHLAVRSVSRAGGTARRSRSNACAARIINNSRPGQVIYDPFLGSGTSLIAAEITGRVCYGIELNPLYVDVVVRRWQDCTGRAARHQVSGRQSFDDRDQRRDPNRSGAAHG